MIFVSQTKMRMKNVSWISFNWWFNWQTNLGCSWNCWSQRKFSLGTDMSVKKQLWDLMNEKCQLNFIQLTIQLTKWSWPQLKLMITEKTVLELMRQLKGSCGTSDSTFSTYFYSMRALNNNIILCPTNILVLRDIIYILRTPVNNTGVHIL